MYFPYHASPVLWWGVNLILYATGSFSPSPSLNLYPLPCIPRPVMRGEFDSICYRVLFSLPPLYPLPCIPCPVMRGEFDSICHRVLPPPLSTPYHASPVLWWGVNLILYATGSFFPSPPSTPYHASPVLWCGVNLILYATGSFFPSSKVVFILRVASPSDTLPFFMSCMTR